jgi:hypothetical protein
MVFRLRTKIFFGNIFLILLLWILPQAWAGGGINPVHSAKVDHIRNYYPEQLTNPQKKTRKSMAQFGYDLSYFTIPLFPITGIINPENLGEHSYSRPGFGEKNGTLYTCNGGFIDFSHLRAAADWTVYLAFTILNDPDELELPPEAGTLKLKFKNIDDLSIQEITDLAQKIAFERLVWHEVASWHYHAPYHMRSDQQSTFSPEDNYSNLLGTEIGKKIALRILNDMETLPYADIATEEIQKVIASLNPVDCKRKSKLAFDIVDRHVQQQLPENERNNDVWWDSNILFRDQRYMFKRNTDVGPEVEPWLVPKSVELGCVADPMPFILKVPLNTQGGVSFYEYYDFTITPDTAMFYGHKGKKVHVSFDTFSTRKFDDVLHIIASEMEKVFLAGFNKRDSCDPVQEYQNVRRVGLPVVMRGRND